MRSAPIIATSASHPGTLLVLGTTALFLGAAIALVASNSVYGSAGWGKKVEAYGRIAAYGGAISLFLGVYGELGPGQVALRATMVVPALLCLLALLGSSLFLRRRSRGQKKGVQEQPGLQANGRVPASGRKQGDGDGAAEPEPGAQNGDRAEPTPPVASRP